MADIDLIISVVILNVNGLHNPFKGFRPYEKKNYPIICCLQETQLDLRQIDKQTNKRMEKYNSNSNHWKGGVAKLILEKID